MDGTNNMFAALADPTEQQQVISAASGLATSQDEAGTTTSDSDVEPMDLARALTKLVQQGQTRTGTPKDAPVLDDAVDLHQFEIQLRRWKKREECRGITDENWFEYASDKFVPGTRSKRVNEEPDETFGGPEGVAAFMEVLYLAQGFNKRTAAQNQLSVLAATRAPGTPVSAHVGNFDIAKRIHERYEEPKWQPSQYVSLLIRSLNFTNQHDYLRDKLLDKIETLPPRADPYQLVHDMVLQPDSTFARVHVSESNSKAFFQREEDDGEEKDEAVYYRENRRGSYRNTRMTAQGRRGNGSRYGRSDNAYTTAGGVNRTNPIPRERMGQKGTFKPKDVTCFNCSLQGHFANECKIPKAWGRMFLTLYDSLKPFRDQFPKRHEAAVAFYRSPNEYLPLNWTSPDIKLDETMFTFYVNNLPTNGRQNFKPRLTAIPDTGSPTSVCGRRWLQTLCDLEDIPFPVLRPPRGSIRFGSNEKADFNLGWAILTIRFHTTSGSVESIQIEVDVVDTDVPLLLSKRELQQWNAQINFSNNVFSLLLADKLVEIQAMDSGSHFHLPLVTAQDKQLRAIGDSPYWLVQYCYSPAQLTKIHRQFGHRPLSEMLELLQVSDPNIEADDLQIYQDIHESCDLCNKYRRPPPAPIVSVPKAKTPGEILHMDIMFVHGEAILLVVDSFTNFKIAHHFGGSRNPSKAQCLEALSNIFFSSTGPGIPDSVVWDLESGLNAQDVIEWMHMVGVREIVTTPRDAHFYNGLVETAITPLRRQIKITMEEKRIDVKTALPLATFILNAAPTLDGISSLYLWHGRKIRSPADSESLSSRSPTSDERAQHPALEHLYTLQQARDSHFSAKAKERIQRALRAQVRKVTDLSDIARGTLVYVYRDGPGGKLGHYEGPFPFIGDDGSRRAVVITGSKIMLVHASRLVPTRHHREIAIAQSTVPANSIELQEPLKVQTDDLDLENALTDVQEGGGMLQTTDSSISTVLETLATVPPQPLSTNRVVEPTNSQTDKNQLLIPAVQSQTPGELQHATSSLLGLERANSRLVAEKIEGNRKSPGFIHPVEQFGHELGQLTTISVKDTSSGMQQSSSSAPGNDKVHPADRWMDGDFSDSTRDVPTLETLEEPFAPIADKRIPLNTNHSDKGGPAVDPVEATQVPVDPRFDTPKSTFEPFELIPSTRQTRSGRVVNMVDYAALSGKRQRSAPATPRPAKHIAVSIGNKSQRAMDLGRKRHVEEDRDEKGEVLPKMPRHFIQTITDVASPKVHGRTENVEYEHAIQDPKFLEAMADEVNSFYTNKCVRRISRTSIPRAAKVLSTRWVLTKKHTLDQPVPRYKARLAIRGYEDPDKNEVQTYAPTMLKGTLRFILTVLAQHQWQPHSLDFTTAFLQGSEVHRELFIQPPPTFVDDSEVWQVLRGIYGLPSAPAAWYLKLHQNLEACGFQRSVFDPALYTFLVDFQLQGVFGVHVDDGCYGGTALFHQAIAQLRAKLKCKEPKQTPFDFCGLQIDSLREKGGKIRIEASQQTFAQSIRPMNPSCFTPTEYRALVGKLLYLIGQTRPDLAFRVSVAASKNKNPCLDDVQQVNEIVELISVRSSKLVFQQVADPMIVVFSDASWANLADKGSQGGYVVLLVDRDMSRVGGVIDYRSHKLKRVARSSLTAETLAASEGIDAAIWVSALLGECKLSDSRFRVYTDCHDLFQSSRNKNVTEERRLMINITGIRQDIEAGLLELVWLPTSFNVADIMTKAKASRFQMDLLLDNNKLLHSQYEHQVKIADAESLNYFFRWDTFGQPLATDCNIDASLVTTTQAEKREEELV